MKPVFSIITVTYNSSEYIARCVDSVLSQDFKNFEILIIDGESKDDTINILKNFQDDRIRINSEPDDGIYDAMNKGLSKCSGDYICILNSDDLFSNAQVLTTLNKYFMDGNDIIIGDIDYFAFTDISRITRKWRVPEFDIKDFKQAWHPPHPGFFFKRDLYQQLGGFDIELEISADFEMMLRYLIASKQTKVLHKVTTLMQEDGTSSKLKNVIIGNKNVLKALKKHDMGVNPVIYLVRRILPKIINRLVAKFVS